MHRKHLKYWGDIALAVLVFGGAAVLLIGAAELPPPRFEPLGSAAVPRGLAAILIVLGLWVAVRAVLGMRADAPVASPEGTASHPLRSLGVLAALIAYVAALDLGQLPFLPMTALFLAASGTILSGGGWRPALVYGALGLALAGALSFIFSNFLYIEIG
ncbi:hypothetical protein GE300_04385 [Rhodobacteraceae bacterium 2CG4]|uniref:DUF1468 domain-containing protein n=1 Tax=Halovulum marinum TaxID=2662447 RepID=A0A6L5YY49_9RHOB|nr:tripartite tricarboxylate transporter TctB family protein [Halovulum marinum]MSU88860.1 hypothetical protein [Halovulum marinum]